MHGKHRLLLAQIGLLISLTLCAISQQSLYHLSLFILVLSLNAIFAYRRRLWSSTSTTVIFIVYLSLHLLLLLVVQIGYVQQQLNEQVSKVLGLPYFICSTSSETNCVELSWSMYAGVLMEICLIGFLIWLMRLSVLRIESVAELLTSSLKYTHLLTPVSMIVWPLLFPSWLSFIWVLGSWLIFSLITHKHYRLLFAPYIIGFASLLLTIPFYLMRYFDGQPTDTLNLLQNRGVLSESTSQDDESCFEWITPFMCLFTCILYICLYYIYTLMYVAWRPLSADQWFSVIVGDLSAALWMPYLFIFLLIFVYTKRLNLGLETVRKPSSELIRAIAANYDTMIAIAMCAFAANNVSVVGIIVLMLSLMIYTSNLQRSHLSRLTATLILCILWLMLFISYALQLPVVTYPEKCDKLFSFDRDTLEWIGLGSGEIWQVIILLIILSMRTVLPSEDIRWLETIQRSDAEQDLSSLLKFLSKYWMHKFGIEVCSIVGIIVATCHYNIFGFYYFIMVAIMRLISRRRQKLFWNFYANCSLIVLILEYLAVLGLPKRLLLCSNQFWNNWHSVFVKYMILPLATTSHPLLIADYILLLLILVQKEIFSRPVDHNGGDNRPLSEIDIDQPIPSMYNDFTSTKGDLLAYIHSAVFLHSHWLTVITVLVCGIEGGTLLDFGYVGAVFVLMWNGTESFVCHPYHQFLTRWRHLVHFNLFVIAAKMLHLNVICQFLMGLPCWMEIGLGLRCAETTCPSTIPTSTLIFDVVCFAALTIQTRIFNSWYFQIVLMDYRADHILGTRGAELLLEVKNREARRNQRLQRSNLKWLELMVADEDSQLPESYGHQPRSHEEIKRCGYYHQTSERFFPRFLRTSEWEFESRRRFSALSQFDHTQFDQTNVLTSVHDSTMVEKTVERLRQADSLEKLQLLRGELTLRDDFQSIVCSEALWNEALEEYRAIHPAFKFLYCISHSVLAQSELVCFILMLVVHLSKSSLLTLPLPFMVFFWGALCIPRPPKAFWLFIAFYTQFIIIFRLVFRNIIIPGFESDTEIDNNPFSLRKLLAMDPNVGGTYWEIALLSMLFLHRYKLLRLGLWGDGFESREQRIIITFQSSTDEDSDANSHEETDSYESFFEAILMKKTPSSMDWYPWMVGSDAMCVVLISFFYSMIGQGGTGNVLLDVQASRLPRWIAYTLPIVVMIMIIDRWLHLAKKAVFRFIFYICLVLLLHIVIFLFVPSITGRSVTWNGLAITIYLIKSIYLLMSAWHMRNGYSSVLNTNILAQNFGLFRLIILKIYLNIPFLFELRTAMDWTFTSTALTMGDFIRMENYYNELVSQYCWIRFDHWLDNYYPTRRGRPTPTSGKFFKGVSSVIALIIIILAPVLVFALLNSFGTRAPPRLVKFTIAVEGYPNVYSTETVFNVATIPRLTAAHMQSLMMKINGLDDSDLKRSALSFISDYTYKDIFIMEWGQDSLTKWEISTPGKSHLMNRLRDTKNTLHMIFEMSVLRPVDDTQRLHSLLMSIALMPSQTESLLGILENNVASANFSFPLPQFLLAPPNGYLSSATAINMALRRTSIESEWSYSGEHWTIRWNESFVIFVDRVVPSWMSIVVGSGGMVAMYVAVVLVVGRFVREIVRTPIANALVENIPNCDNFLRLFQDIYIVREKRHFFLESRLYGKLIFIMRSPETMIRWSRYNVKVKEH